MIHEFGRNSFMAVEGLIERTERAIYEDSVDKALHRIRRWMAMPRAKKQRFDRRYIQWLTYRVKGGADRDELVSLENHHARIALQQNWNKES